MKHLPISVLAALVVAASVPAQFRLEADLGRHVRGVLNIGDHRHDGQHDHRSRRNHRDPGCRPPVQRGHWETVHEQVLVPGYWREEHVPPTYGWITDHCGRRRWGIVDPGGCRRVWVPARWETRCRQVWVGC